MGLDNEVREAERVMVLGAGGRVGSEMCRQLPDERCIPRSRETLDIRDSAAIRQHLEAVKPSVVINVAAMRSHKAPQRDQYDVNVVGALNVFSACGDLGIPLIHLSTGDVFGGFHEPRAHFEDDPCFAASPSLSMRIAAEHAMVLRKQTNTAKYWTSGFRFWLIRSSLLFASPRKFTGGFVHDLLNRLEQRRDSLYESRDTVRSPTYIPWLAKELLWLADNRAKVMEGVYHVCSTGSASLYNVATYIAARVRHSGAKVLPCSHEEYAARNGVKPEALARHTALNNDKWAAVRNASLPTWQSQLDMFLQVGTK
jgi:dTDP-4-dehydrorhamnose reductase